MKKFLLHILIFSIVAVASMCFILSLADGHSDPFYLKLSSKKQNNLIIGTSKAAQGIQPGILKGILHKDFYNYAFAVDSSPFGSVYLNSIKQKLNTPNKDNIFIVTVDPWSICSRNENPNDASKFRENKMYLNHIKNVNANPNFKYLLNYTESYYTILLKNSPGFLHNDGWLEVTLDENGIKKRTAFTMKSYRESAPQYHFSRTRFLYLMETINFLKQYGKVYLVRMPVSPDVKEIERTMMPDFNTTIQQAINKSEKYLDLTGFNKDLKYTDGVHLDKNSGTEVSERIAEWVKN